MDAAVAEALRSRRDQIIASWFKRVSERPAARHLPHDVVMNNIPGLVDTIIERLAKGSIPPGTPIIPRDISKNHGESRLGFGYGLQELGEEYNSLRDAFLDALDEAGVRLDNETASVLHGAVDQAPSPASSRSKRRMFRSLRWPRMSTRSCGLVRRSNALTCEWRSRAGFG